MRRALLCGLAGAGLFFFLIFLLSILMNKSLLIQRYSAAAVKGILLLCAVIIGLTAPGIAVQNRLLTALAGEGVLLLCILAVCASAGFSGSRFSFAADLVILLFGAFDGALRRGGRGNKRRGKRKYRA